MKRLAALVLLLFIGSVAYSTPTINPSGVWSWSGLKMTSVAEFSWGVNPRSIESEIIDLNADPAYIVVSSEKFIVTSIDQKGFLFIFSGYWADDRTPGSLSVLFGIDGDTMYYIHVEPEYRSGLIDNGEHGWFVRVPVDAPIVEIGPEGP